MPTNGVVDSCMNHLIDIVEYLEVGGFTISSISLIVSVL